MDHSGSYRQQGGGELGYTGNGYVTDNDPAVTGAAVAASVGVPAFDDRASRTTGNLTEEIQRRSVSIGQLFGKSVAAMGSKKQVSGLEVRKVVVLNSQRWEVVNGICVYCFGPVHLS